MTRFRIKLTLTILGLISLVLLLMGMYFAKVLERSYLETLSELLTRESKLVAQAVRPEVLSDEITLAKRVEQVAPGEEVRLTLIDRTGRVLFDNTYEQERMENHADRPEFSAALRGETGIDRHYSETLGYEMMYVAVPIVVEDQIIGAVRSAMSMQDITDTVHNLWYSLVTGLLVTLVLGSIVVSRISYNITRPIEEITRVARNITQREYESRVRIKAKDEIGQLATAINFMASSLEQQMYEISENQQRLSGVLTNMTSGVIFISEQRRIMLVNPAVERLLGTSANDLIGKLHIEAGKSFGLSQYIDRCLDRGEKFRQEVHIYYPQERILEVNFAPYINFKGEAKGVVVVLHDFTEVRRLEKMRSDFVANVSHELRTPITSIKGFTETLLDGAMQDEETCRNFLQIISDESERLYRMIRDILDLSKIEQKRISLNLVQVNVQDLISSTVALLQDQAQRKQISITLPKAEPRITLTTDKDCLQQIILNLVTNAVVYTPEGGAITLELRQDSRHVQIQVTDTGIGIPEQDLPRIFERFYRVDKARSRDSGGTGLGLAIVKHLVESLHGQITVKSVEGKGSTFTVTLPIEW
ncbi:MULTISPECIES: two-component system histidine kinase PnpS [Brevibacillus]|uniref:two-component system histidine kinase PnpS n=1 Tax=Brevibacillus TaxID=55080 RepID=UPI000468E109|nr:ATP-binding protein [Brevibacillus borstelensis]KKX55502.1 histidine kinase [Brevibacillus borstelensis cifa_chp40]MBE5397532.1 HAMP domain-containing protein [Brevibacillus borstelensis]MCC0564942.1 cell wall metabolism sensor histidine kinase WalK [Brevibacillus borstelensis]MCM3469172.1 cell wall metabolism sensor histidine kinase WalK [Brevibacillus borstelensis]MCM3560061.1 cell wall metabolism sensor histidine kinase WalK [Brevibacillus borstelensis]